MDGAQALTQNGKPVLLVVDDYPENLTSMRALLARDDWQVLTAGSGIEALETLLVAEVDLVILDVHMPDMDGFEVARLMRGSQRTRQTPIIFLTATEHSDAAVLKGYQNGALDYLFKPFDPQVLKPKVQALLEQQRDRRLLQQLARELEAAKAFNASILDHAAEGILVVGQDGTVSFANPAIAALLGRDIASLAQADALDLIQLPCTQAWRDTELYQAYLDRRVLRVPEAHLRTAGGELLPVALSCAPLPVEQCAMVMTVLDMSLIRHLHQQLEHQAVTDPLTGLLNRRGFHQCAEAALLRFEHVETAQALLYLDLDGFKRINDAVGHDAGDTVLRWVAQQLRECLGAHALLARMGGDEFTALLDGLAYPEQAARFAETLIERIAGFQQVDGVEVSVGVSIGIATYPDCATQVDGLVQAADQAMYAAKQAGRQQYRFYDHELNGRAHARMQLEDSVRTAIDQQGFNLVYQPQVAFADGRLRGFEALLRWQHPSIGDVPPGLFIPLLEEARLINRLSSWIYRKGAAQRHAWQQRFTPDLVLAISLSRAQFFMPGLAEELRRIRDDYALLPQQLEVEVAETSLLYNLDEAAKQVQRLHEHGVQVALDDFGTGECSLRMLRELPVDTLKIDRQVVARLPQSAVDCTWVRGVIELCALLEITVIAEGVETPAQACWLRDNGCDYVQGFLVARPLTVVDASAFAISGPCPWQ